MMKSFFKKLAFVMALAMVVSMAAPAGSVFAAESGIAFQDTKEIVTEYELKEIGATVDFCFLGAPSDWKSTFKWESSNESVATVDKAGIVTAVAPGTATITITAGADKSYVEAVKITVKGEFEAKQVSDSKVELTFSSNDVTKASLEAALNFYYYIGEYKVDVNLIKSISEVKNGVATVELYTTVTDGTVYGFAYGNETAEFTAKIGEVASILFTYDKAYVDANTKLTPVLYNADGIDITKTALKVQGSYVLFTEEEQAENGEYWLSNDEIYFTEVTAAMIKVQYFGGYDDNGEEKVGPYQVLPVVSEKKPAYGIDFTANPTYTIAESAKWDSINKNIAVGDEGYKLFVKTKDNTGTEVTSADSSNGAWSFESSNVSKLYVTDDGLLMPNAQGSAIVLVYYTPVETNVKSLVAAINVTVSARRATTNVSLNKTSASISTVDGYNEAIFEVTLKDALGTVRRDETVTVKTTTNVTNATAKPGIVVLKTVTDKDGKEETKEVVDVSGEVTLTTGEDGKATIKVIGSEANIAANSTSGVQTYSFTVTANNITKSFSVTIKKPVTSNGAIVASGYKLTTNGVTDVKVTKNATIDLTATLEKLSNGVTFATQTIAGAKPDAAAKATKDAFYYTVTKNGSDITSKTSVSGATISVGLTKEKTTDNGVYTTVNVDKDGAFVSYATTSSLQMVEKTQGAATYKVTIYQAVTANGVATPSAFKTVTSTTVTVGDTQDTASYAGKSNSYAAVGSSKESIAMNCFKFKIGNKTYVNAADYTDAYIVVEANTVNKGNVVFVNSVDIYKATETKTDAYIKYTITVNDYVTLQ